MLVKSLIRYFWHEGEYEPILPYILFQINQNSTPSFFGGIGHEAYVGCTGSRFRYMVLDLGIGLTPLKAMPMILSLGHKIS